MMKGYAGGLVRFRRIGRLHIGSLGACPDDVSVSFTVCWVSGFREGTDARQTMTFGPAPEGVG